MTISVAFVSYADHFTGMEDGMERSKIILEFHALHYFAINITRIAIMRWDIPSEILGVRLCSGTQGEGHGYFACFTYLWHLKGGAKG